MLIPLNPINSLLLCLSLRSFLPNMVSVRLVTLLSAFAAAVSAAPAAPIVDEPALNITEYETLDRNLRNGEMVVFGTGNKG